MKHEEERSVRNWREGKLTLKVLAIATLISALPLPTRAVDSRARLSQYSHTAWRVQDGSLNSVPTAMAQTKDGYLWIGTNTDLLRFDGVRFTSFTQIAPTLNLPVLRVDALYGASDGSLWIGAFSDLYRWKGGVLSRYPVPGGRVKTILEDRKGVIWIGRFKVRDRTWGACYFKEEQMRCLANLSGEPGSIYAMAEEANGALWFAGLASLTRYASGATKAYPIDGLQNKQGFSNISALAADPKGGIWVGFEDAGAGFGLEHFDNGVYRSIRIGQFDSSHFQVTCISVDREGSLWIGGAGLLRIRDGRIEEYRSNDGLSGDIVRQVLQDQEGNIWVRTDSGIDRFRDFRVITYRAPGSTPDSVLEFLAAREGRWWADNAPQLEVPNQQGSSVVRKTRKLPEGPRTSILQDHNGSIWLGIGTGLYLLAHGKVTPVLRVNGAPVGVLGYIVEDTSHIIWLSVFTGNDNYPLYILPGEHIARVFPSKLAVSRGTIADVHSGIWILDRSNTLTHVYQNEAHSESLSALGMGTPQSIFQGADGTTYVWCLEGLILVRQHEVRMIRAPSVGSCQIYASIFDSTGALWSAGLCGLLRFDAGQVRRWWADPNAGIQSQQTLDASDGFYAEHPNFSPAVSRSFNGSLWFVGPTRIQVMDPSESAAKSTPLPAYIEDLVADQHQLRASGTVRLPPRTRDLEFEYTALSFVNPQKVLFRYKLIGRDEDWKEAGTRRQAFYTDLRPGHYTFQVIARNSSGVWNEQGASFQFNIAPAWYQTLWFQLLAIASTLCALVCAYLVRVRGITARIELRVHERMSERMRISRELHDTLLQALQGIVIGFSSFTPRVSPEIRQEMERSLDNAESLLVSGRDRLKEMRGYIARDGDIATEIRSIADGLFQHLQCNVTVKVDGVAAQLKSIVYEESMWIVREALTNASRHSKAHNLNVQVFFTSKDFRVSIQDDGIGLAAHAFLAHHKGHFGLVGMRERTEAMGGRFNVRSDKGHGTSINLSLPSRVAYIAQQRWWNRFFSSRSKRLAVLDRGD